MHITPMPKNQRPDLEGLIRAQGVSAVALAVGVRDATVYYWLREWQQGRRLSGISAERAFRLADAIGCNARDLIEG